MRICENWFSAFERKVVPNSCNPQLHASGVTVELEVAELLPLLHHRENSAAEGQSSITKHLSSQETLTDLVSIYKKIMSKT